MSKKRLLITGAGGSLGKQLIENLKVTNYDFLGISRHKKGSKIKNVNLQKLNEVKNIIKSYKPDIIIHLAALTGNYECESKPHKAFLSNVFSTYNILRASIIDKQKIIFASTREVYGNCKNATEDSPRYPINVNGTTKMLSEDLIIKYNKMFGIPYTILRFTNFYSADFSNRGISNMIKNAVTGKKISIYGGNQSFDLLHYNDAANAIIKGISRSGTFNVGGEHLITPIRLVKKLELHLGSSIRYEIKPYRDFEVKRFSIDLSKSKKILKFTPTKKFDMVLKNMIKKWSKVN